MTDLSLVPLKELADEVMKRSSCGIILVTSIEHSGVYWNWCGGYHQALGHTVDMADLIKKENNRMEED